MHTRCAVCRRRGVVRESQLTCTDCQELNTQFIDNLRIIMGQVPLYEHASKRGGQRAAKNMKARGTGPWKQRTEVRPV